VEYHWVISTLEYGFHVLTSLLIIVKYH